MEQPIDESKLSPNHWDGASWIALYTTSRAEKQVEQRLLQEGFECYLPIVRERHQWSDRMQWVERPFIASYIFARIRDVELSRVCGISGIVCPITFGVTRKVARITDSNMEAFRAIVESEKKAQVVDADVFCKGVLVEVVGGDFKGQQGHLISVNGETLFGVLLEGVSIAAAVALDVKLLKVVEKKKKKK